MGLILGNSYENTPSTIVSRDASGNFSAGTITADLTGTATIAVDFTGILSGDITGTQSTTTLSDTIVTNKLLTGYNTGANVSILASDSILQAFQKVQGQINSSGISAITALTGDGTATGPGSAVFTLATVNLTTGSFGSSTAIPSFTVNGKGLITAASTNAVIAPASTLTGTTLASNVVTSLLTSVGTIVSGIWNGTAITVANGGTSQTSYTDGQLLIGNTSGNTLTKATLTAGTNVSITNGNGSISIAATGSPVWNYISQSSALNPAVLGSYYLLSGASFTITLPTAASVSGQGFVFEHGGTSISQVYTFNTTSGQTVGGVGSGLYAFYTNGESFTLVSDGSNWQIINRVIPSTWTSINTIYITATSAYVFTVTSANATVGATYTNNGFTYTVTTTIAPSTTLTCSGTGAPSASGTLTKTSGTGDATITFSSRTVTGVPVKGNSPTTDLMWYRREADSAHIRIYFSNSTASGAAAGSGDYLFQVSPSIGIIDITKCTLYNAVEGVGAFVKAFGIGQSCAGEGASCWQGDVVVYSTDYVRTFGFDTATIGVIGSGFYNLNDAETWYSLDFVAPIVGWRG